MMQFGVFDHLDRNDLSLAEYYEARLKIIESYDRFGFYAYHVAEHHSTPLGLAPSPSVFLVGGRAAHQARCASGRWSMRCRSIIRSA